ncbi:hypothetical protein ANANG_G00015970 [Anguilla anguilla]|uniref:ALIX V-shaped domain-containing protein n=1 Tax=Anguilla anguilla TaxID=7936 RepID=A0A9D3N1I4_ANGAN|nr:hypothetical protein ANANG_G00015970 [Anguilla anguilla]
MKKERGRIESGIKSVEFDMTGTFLSALAQGSTIDEEALSTRQLDNTYGGYSQEVQKSLKTQEELLANVQTLHQKFSGMKQTSAESIQREEVMKKLASAYDSYMEMTTNLQEGTKFYGDLTVILLKFQNNCSDIVFARKTELDDLLKVIQQTLAQEPSAPSIPPATTDQASTTTTTTSTSTSPQADPFLHPGLCFTPTASNPDPAQASSTTSVETPGLTSPAQGPPYPTYQGHPGFFPMPMGWSPFGYGQYNMPYLPYQSLGQVGYPAATPPQPQNQPNYP